MEFAKNMMVILLTAILAENFILTKFLGICPFLGVSKKLDSAVGMSAAVIFVMVIATAVTFPIYVFLLEPYELAYLETLVFILVIAALVQLVEMVLKKFMPALHRALGVYLPLITTNCAVLGWRRLGLYAGDGSVCRCQKQTGFGKNPQMLSGYADHFDRCSDCVGCVYGLWWCCRRIV